MAALIGRALAGIGAASMGGWAVTKYKSEEDSITKHVINSFLKSDKSPQPKQSPMNFVINVPENQSNDHNGAVQKIGIVVLASGIIAGIYWYNKDKIVLSKLMNIIKNQESSRKEITSTIRDEAQVICEKVDDTDARVQQVQETTNAIEDDVHGMRNDVNCKLEEISYQNERLYHLATRSLTQGRRYSTPQRIQYNQPRAITFSTPQPIQQTISPGSSPYVERAYSLPNGSQQIQRRSFVQQSETITLETASSSPQQNSGWLNKFGF